MLIRTGEIESLLTNLAGTTKSFQTGPLWTLSRSVILANSHDQEEERPLETIRTHLAAAARSEPTKTRNTPITSTIQKALCAMRVCTGILLRCSISAARKTQ